MRIIYLFIIAYFSISGINAQTTNYYTINQLLKENGYTYQCDVIKGGEVRLYNSKNKWTYTDQMKKGTNVPFYVTPENYELFIITCISSETGEISELYFDFSNRTPYATVPISVYREIETN